jgi:hypothetical protein
MAAEGPADPLACDWAAAVLQVDPWSVLGPRVPLPVAAVALETVKPPPQVGIDTAWTVSVLVDIRRDDDGVWVTDTETVMVPFTMTNDAVDDSLYGAIAANFRAACAAAGVVASEVRLFATMCVCRGEDFVVPWVLGAAAFRDMSAAIPGVFTVLALTEQFLDNFAAGVVRPALLPSVRTCRLNVVCVRQDDLLPTPMLVANGGMYEVELDGTLAAMRRHLRHAPRIVDTFGEFAASAVATGDLYSGTLNTPLRNDRATLRAVFRDHPGAMHVAADQTLDTFVLMLVWPKVALRRGEAYLRSGEVYLHVIVGGYRAGGADLDGNDMRALAQLPQAICKVKPSITVHKLRQGWQNATIWLNPPSLPSLTPTAFQSYGSPADVVVMGSAQPWAVAVRGDVTVRDIATPYRVTMGPGSGAEAAAAPAPANDDDDSDGGGVPALAPSAGPTHLYIMVRPPSVQAAGRVAAERAWHTAAAVVAAQNQAVQVTVHLADDGAIAAEVQLPFQGCTVAAVKAALVAKRVAPSVRALGDLSHPETPTVALADADHAVRVCELLKWTHAPAPAAAKLEIVCTRTV